MTARLAYLLFLLSVSAEPGYAQAVSAESRPPMGWAWERNAGAASVIVLLYEQTTLRLRRAYQVDGGAPRCSRPALPDSAFSDRARAFLTGATGTPFARELTLEPLGPHFVRVIGIDGDSLYWVVFHRNGAIVFSASRGWMGLGTQLAPADPIDPWHLHDLSDLAPAPVQLSTPSDMPPEALGRLRHLNVVHSLGVQPYSLTAFGWNRWLCCGELDPSWVVLVAREGKCY